MIDEFHLVDLAFAVELTERPCDVPALSGVGLLRKFHERTGLSVTVAVDAFLHLASDGVEGHLHILIAVFLDDLLHESEYIGIIAAAQRAVG